MSRYCAITSPLQISTPGARGRTFITQIYFRDRVPRGFETYVRRRATQYGRVSFLAADTQAGLGRGGRLVQFSVRLDV